VLGEVVFGESFAFFSEPLFHGWIDGKLFTDGMAGEIPFYHVSPLDLVICAICRL
jgi:hypothetical protein